MKNKTEKIYMIYMTLISIVLLLILISISMVSYEGDYIVYESNFYTTEVNETPAPTYIVIGGMEGTTNYSLLIESLDIQENGSNIVVVFVTVHTPCSNETTPNVPDNPTGNSTTNITHENSTYMVIGYGNSSDGYDNIILDDLSTEEKRGTVLYCNETTRNGAYLGQIKTQEEYGEIYQNHIEITEQRDAEIPPS